MELTKLEKTVLKNWELPADTLQDVLDDNYSWMYLKEIHKETDINIKSLKGTLSSLVQKNLVGYEVQRKEEFGWKKDRKLFFVTDEAVEMIFKIREGAI